MLELAVGPQASKTFLKRINQQYSKKLFDVVSALLDDAPSRRLLAFDLIKQQVVKPALIEAINKETECTFEHFKDRLNKFDEAVN